MLFEKRPNEAGFRKRMLGIWQEKGIFEVCEQRLADQARAIRINGWLTELEIEDIARSIKEGGEHCKRPGRQG